MRAHHPQPPDDVIARLRLVCMDLPEVCEEAAWVGRRWTVRRKNFAHVLCIDQGWPPAYVRAAGTAGPACVLTFRLPVAAVESPRFGRAPYFRPAWWPDIAGMVIDHQSDWDEIGSLLLRSYCALAPRALSSRIEGA